MTNTSEKNILLYSFHRFQNLYLFLLKTVVSHLKCFVIYLEVLFKNEQQCFNEAKCNLGKVKTKPMQRCCLGYLGGGFQGGLQGHCHVLWLELPFRLLASLPSLPPLFWGKY